MPFSMQTQGIWNNWVGTNEIDVVETTTAAGFNGNRIWNTWIQDVNQRQWTREEMEQMQAANAAAARERELRFATAREAESKAIARALELFLHVLRPDERETYEKEQCVYVRGSRGRRYRIRCGRGQSHNVELLGDKNEVLSTLCAHPGERVPGPDAWMVQKLTIEHDEDHFTNKANFSNHDLKRRLLLPA